MARKRTKSFVKNPQTNKSKPSWGQVLWLMLGHCLRYLLKRYWPEIYTSRRALQQAESSLKALQSQPTNGSAEVAELRAKIQRLENTIDGLERDLALRGDDVSDLILQCQRALGERDATIARLVEMANQDPLTRLTNRRGRDHEFAGKWRIAATQAGTTVAAVAIDLDRFKWVNDTLGHAIGDELLCLFADRLRTYFKRGSDLVVRLGGDEFLVIGFSNDGHKSVQKQCQELIEAMRQSDDFLFIPEGEGTSVRVTASIGIATRVITAVDEVAHADVVLTELMQRADTALYEAKRLGRDQIALEKDMTVFAPLGE